MIHIQLDDSQLYQIFWSFLIVYIIILLMYSVFVIMSVIYDSLSILKTTFRLLMFTLLYQLIEIVLRKYNLMIIVIRLILIFLVKAWKSLNYQIVVALQLQPELRLQVLGGILGRSR